MRDTIKSSSPPTTPPRSPTTSTHNKQATFLDTTSTTSYSPGEKNNSSNHHHHQQHASPNPSPEAVATSPQNRLISTIFTSSCNMIMSKHNNLRMIKLGVLFVLCFQNSVFTVLRRYSQGVLRETYSKHEVLLFGEVVKMLFSARVIYHQIPGQNRESFVAHLKMLAWTSRKMFALSLIYGLMNILSYVALRNVSAGIFTICAQLKILTTACFSALLLQRRYSWTQWRALLTLIIGVLIFSEPIWNQTSAWETEGGNVLLGSAAVLTEVTLSGFASIYFEKVIKTDTQQNLNIWERNFQLALGSFPVYLAFIIHEGGGKAGYLGGWSMVTLVLALLGAAGGLLVALSIKYGDAILKTLATTGAIVLSSLLDHWWLKGPLTANMMLAGAVVITAICDYSFDATPLQAIVAGSGGMVIKSGAKVGGGDGKQDGGNVVGGGGGGSGSDAEGEKDVEMQKLMATRENKM